MAFKIPNAADAIFADQAEPDSVDIDILVAGHEQSGVKTGCAVTAQASPNMTVAVASGTAYWQGTEVAVSGGNVTITAAHGTYARFDLVVVNSSGTKSATAGTASANPVFPAVPASSVVLAAVYVPANDTDIDADQIIDKRVIVKLPPTPGGAFNEIVKSADQDRTSTTTVAADSELTFSADGSAVYEVRCLIVYSAHATPDIKWNVLVPSGARGLYTMRHKNTSATLTFNIDEPGPLSDLSSIGEGVGTYEVIVVEALLVTSSSGTVAFGWAQNTSSVETTRVEKGSSMLWRKISAL